MSALSCVIIVVSVLIELAIFVVLPANDSDKVCHKTRDLALDESVVAHYDILLFRA